MKSPKDIEVRILSLELSSMQARMARMEEQLDNSVPLEKYQACVAEKESLEAELERSKSIHKEEIDCINEVHRKDIDALHKDYRSQIAGKEAEIEALKSEQKKYSALSSILQAENVDCKKLIEFWQGRQFGRSSEAMVDEMEKLVGRLPEDKQAFMTNSMAMINRINRTHGEPCPRPQDGEEAESEPPKGKKAKKSWNKKLRCSDIRRIFDIDFSDLPPGSKIAMRTVYGKRREEVREIEVLHYSPGRFYSEIYKVGNCNVPGADGTRQSKRPLLLFGKIAVDASFARFYLEMKFKFNRSEGQIVKIMRTLGCTVDQATLNRWMHAIIQGLMDIMLAEMLKEIRESRFTHNDETRILARSLDDKTDRLKYSIEYIHGILSPSKKLFVMLYKKGSRAHDVQMEVFDGSMIEAFTADRCDIYRALQKEFGTPPIRGACWVHFRRYLLNAYHQDSRLEPAVQLLARIFFAEKLISKRKNLTETERVRERKDMCKPLVEAIVKFMQGVRDAGDEYGTLAQRAANYLLDDKEGFSAFLENGLVEISNNAIERCFRRLALGRRNWQQCGSHKAAEHTAFIYSLVESCEMNHIDFGDYIEYLLREIQGGNQDYRSLLPNRVKLPRKEKAANAA